MRAPTTKLEPASQMDFIETTQQQDSASGDVTGISWWAQRESTILLFAALVWVTLVVTRGITKGEFNYITDETLHAVTGLYFADFLHDLPLTHAVQYTFRYEVQYPALGLLHWPPFFHFVEGVMFLVAGRSVVVARLTILMFALFGFYFWFKLVTELDSPWTAAASTAVLASHPVLLVHEKIVMLEIPALALSIAAIWFWFQYFKRGRGRDIWWFALLASAAVLTKYQSIYLFLFCLLTIAIQRKWRRLMNPALLGAAAVAFLLIVPYGLVAYELHGRQLVYLALQVGSATYAGHKLPPAPNPYTYYWSKLPAQLGWPLFALSVVGLVSCKWWAKKESALTMLMWIAACYLTMTFISAEEPRYIIYWIPPWVYFALGPLTAKSTGRMRFLRGGAACGLVLAYAGWAWSYQRPYVSGFEAAARSVSQRGGPRVVVFDGDLPGNFVFFMRSLDPARRFFIVRKLLAVVEGSAAIVKKPTGLEDLIDDYGIKSIVISENVTIGSEGQARLRGLLQTDEFRLVQRFPVETNVPEFKDHNLLLYEKVHPQAPSKHTLTLKVSQINRELTVPLDDSVQP